MFDSATPWTVAHQAPLSMRFPRQEYGSELPFPSPGDLPDPGIEPTSPAWQVDSLPLSHLGSYKIGNGNWREGRWCSKGTGDFCKDPTESSPLCLITRVCRSCVGHFFGKCYFCHLNYDDMKTLVKKDKVELSTPYQLKIHKWVIFPVLRGMEYSIF